MKQTEIMNWTFYISSLLGAPTEESWPGVSSICAFIEDLADPSIMPKVFMFCFWSIFYSISFYKFRTANKQCMETIVGPSIRVPKPWSCWSWSSFGKLTAPYTLLFTFLRLNYSTLLLIYWKFIYARCCVGQKMLCLCPNGRISAYEALDHPYLQDWCSCFDHPWWSFCFDHPRVYSLFLCTSNRRIL